VSGGDLGPPCHASEDIISTRGYLSWGSVMRTSMTLPSVLLASSNRYEKFHICLKLSVLLCSCLSWTWVRVGRSASYTCY
jgi:hypothetical protein